ncbi:uncharacterized protein LOC118770845 [Megalops cyprinoides]|uniref:uncharacterized protein LOC118770845 n=1 Tax=Megalops cyprinoides TaxID=118141 RepID=UPI00186452C0|nr:uncharacterized protein LOC118770845 [Megalops cyprinoides]
MTPCILGEDPSSIEAHVKVLHSQYQKMQPDTAIVRDRMQQTVAWRQKEIADGVTVEDTVKKYPFLRTPTGLGDELERIHPAIGNVWQRRFQLDRTEEMDLRAALMFLPFIFRENIDCFITVGECDPGTPYPTIQLTDKDWKMAFTRRAPNIVNVDGVEVCRGLGIDKGVIVAFCTYFVFNLQYSKHLKNTLMFLQRYILKIVVDGDQPLPLTVMRQINLLY